MCTTIELEFSTHIDLAFLEKNIPVRLIRLFTSLRLKMDDGWTKQYKGIVDTGNPVSVIPYSIWRKADTRFLLSDKSELTGIGEGKVFGQLGEITIVFVDKKSTSLPLRSKALLLDDDSIPLLIGFEDILSDIKMVCDYNSEIACFQIPSDSL